MIYYGLFRAYSSDLLLVVGYALRDHGNVELEDWSGWIRVQAVMRPKGVTV